MPEWMRLVWHHCQNEDHNYKARQYQKENCEAYTNIKGEQLQQVANGPA